MSFKVSTEDKIRLIKLTLRHFDDYDPGIRTLYNLIKRLYLLILADSSDCLDVVKCLADLEELLKNLDLVLQKQYNYKAVIKQVNFE